MVARLHTERVWAALTQAARGSRRTAYVAVPYFSEAGSRLLPLKRGDILVVNASDAAVASGQTAPAALRRLATKGVKVYSLETLHAKVYVFEKTAYVGSANASTSSKEHLVEAVLEIRDPEAVLAARRFIGSLCVSRLTRKELNRLAEIYRPPRGIRKRALTPHTKQPRLWIARLNEAEPDPAFVKDLDEGRSVARAKRTRHSYKIDEFWFPGEKAFAVGDHVVQVFTGDDGNVEIFAPAKIIQRTIARRNGRCKTFVFVETVSDRGILLAKAKAKLGQAVSRRLRRGGVLGKGSIRDRLLAYLAAQS